MARLVVSSFMWLGSASVVGYVVSWVSTLLVIRLLLPQDYGLMAMASMPIGLLMVIGDLGVGTVVVQAPTLSEPKLRALFGASLLTYLALAGGIFLCAPVAAAFFAEPRLTPIVRVLSLCFVGMAFSVVPQALVARALQFDRKARIEVLTAVVSSAIGLALALAGWGVWALVGGVLALHLVRAVAFQVVQPCLFLPVPRPAELRGSLRFSGWITLDRILWFGYSNIDVAIAGRALGGALVGVYTVAASLATLPLDKVMSVVNEISLSAFSRMQGDPQRIRQGVVASLQSVSLLAFPISFGMALVAPDLVEIFLGSQWLAAIIPLQILCLICPFRALGVLLAPALFGTGHARLVVENNAITVGCVALALLIGVQWGVAGLCAGWVAGYLPSFCIAMRRTLIALEVPAGPVVRAITFAVAASLAMAVTVLGARGLVAPLTPLLELASLIAIGAALYALVVAVFRPDTLRHVWMLAAQK